MRIPFIIVFGHNASGKTTFTQKFLKEFKLNRVNGDIVRDLIIHEIDYYSDINYSHFTEKAASMNRVTDAFRLNLLTELIEAKAPILIDGASVAKRTRTRYLDLIKGNDLYTTIIIEVSLPEDQLIDRLKKRDQENDGHKWLEQYMKKKKDMYEPVTQEEAEHYLVYNQDNFDHIIERIEKIIPVYKK